MENTMKKTNIKSNVVDLVFMAMFSVIIAACSWISIQIFEVPFTLQTFGIFITLLILGGKKGTVSVIVYVLLGLVGVPVFAGFKSGATALFGPTGGYILGFILTTLVYWAMTKLLGDKLWVEILALILGLAVCYAFGTVWFMNVYTKDITLTKALALCVTPFLIPDALKMVFAFVISKTLKSRVKLPF